MAGPARPLPDSTANNTPGSERGIMSGGWLTGKTGAHVGDRSGTPLLLQGHWKRQGVDERCELTGSGQCLSAKRMAEAVQQSTPLLQDNRVSCAACIDHRGVCVYHGDAVRVARADSATTWEDGWPGARQRGRPPSAALALRHEQRGRHGREEKADPQPRTPVMDFLGGPLQSLVQSPSWLLWNPPRLPTLADL
ncbi:hypothetical protein VTN00DRAFT_171 [Thermoascus crustaceus]|uniref:uncharacterized protein n=1 Tax=Thermoascus crustaceus TaxID=5088 RepID=UPI0037440C31